MHLSDRKSVLITGGAGFIGQHLARLLIAEGFQVRVLDDMRVSPLLETWGDLLALSILDMTADHLEGVDTVYHLASHKSVPESFDRPITYLDNIESGGHLLELCASAQVRRVIVGSTCEVYGEARTIPTSESSPYAPRSPYAASKVGLEMIIRNYQHDMSSNQDITIVRLFNVYGPGERPDAVVPAFCKNAASGLPLNIEGNGRQFRDFSFINTTIHQLRHLREVVAVPMVNLGSGRSTSILDLVCILREIRPELTVKFIPERATEINGFRSDTTLQSALLPMEPNPVPLLDGIRRTLSWWQDQNLVHDQEGILK